MLRLTRNLTVYRMESQQWGFVRLLVWQINCKDSKPTPRSCQTLANATFLPNQILMMMEGQDMAAVAPESFFWEKLHKTGARENRTSIKAVGGTTRSRERSSDPVIEVGGGKSRPVTAYLCYTPFLNREKRASRRGKEMKLFRSSEISGAKWGAIGSALHSYWFRILQ